MATHKRWRRGGESEIEDVAESLTMDQLRTAAVMLGGATKVKFTTKEDAKSAFDLSGPRRKEALQCLRLVEARTPGRHLMFFPLLAAVPADLQSRASLQISDSESSLSFVDCTTDEIFITFEYEARFFEWILTPDRMKKERHARIVRHPTIARIVSRQGEHPFCVFSYQGYGHAATSEDYAEYVGLAKGELEKLGCAFEGFSVKSALEALVKAGSRKFTVFRGSGRGALGIGNFSFSAAHKTSSVENVLGPELARHLQHVPIGELQRALALTIQSAPADSYVLSWSELRVTTRIDFCNLGADFLVTWTDTNRSFAMVDRMFHTLYAAVEHSTDPTAAAWSWLLALESTHVAKMSDVVNRYSLSAEQAQSTIRAALTAGIVEAVFKVHDSDLAEPVPWTTNLLSLRKDFLREDGGTLDGRDPAQIIVGFRRVPK
jgi:hypothetical protein